MAIWASLLSLARISAFLGDEDRVEAILGNLCFILLLLFAYQYWVFVAMGECRGFLFFGLQVEISLEAHYYEW